MSDPTAVATAVRSQWPSQRTVLRLVGAFIISGVCWITWHAITPNNPIDARKSKAQLGCRGLAAASEAFQQDPANAKGFRPRSLDELVRPPWGVQPFLKNGTEDLLDPWGKPYQMQSKTLADGREYVLVFTTAPDGTPISQFGIGPSAQPNN